MLTVILVVVHFWRLEATMFQFQRILRVCLCHHQDQHGILPVSQPGVRRRWCPRPRWCLRRHLGRHWDLQSCQALDLLLMVKAVAGHVPFSIQKVVKMVWLVHSATCANLARGSDGKKRNFNSGVLPSRPGLPRRQSAVREYLFGCLIACGNANGYLLQSVSLLAIADGAYGQRARQM